MAENFRFFDSQIGDVREYNAAEFAEYFETLVDSGLILGALNDLNPTVTGANMIVTVDTGNSFINGRWYENDSTLDNTFDTETIPNDRIDLLVLRLDLNTNERKITFEIVKGTPSVTPVAPTLTRNSTIYELGLAEVFITGGQSFIQSGDLTDLREKTTDDPFSFPNATSKVLVDPHKSLSGNATYTDTLSALQTLVKTIPLADDFINGRAVITNVVNDLFSVIVHYDTIQTNTMASGFYQLAGGEEAGAARSRITSSTVTDLGEPSFGRFITNSANVLIKDIFINGQDLQIVFEEVNSISSPINVKVEWRVDR